MLERPLLSICIPTYNRSQYLRECLAGIRVSARDCLDRSEVVISDNASSDDTQSVADEFRDSFPTLRYHRNSENVGESNFYIVAGMASGEYLWIFGDDDQVTPEAIPAILDRANAGYDLIVSNFSVWSRDFTTV